MKGCCIVNNEIRRNMALFPISIVMELTDLTARQIRYYEERELIKPARTTGNKRLFSLNDIEKLLEIKEMLEQGLNIAGIKKLSESGQGENQAEGNNKHKRELTVLDLYRVLKRQRMSEQQTGKALLNQSELNRYFGN